MSVRQKICTILEWVIGGALSICLFLGGLGFLGYIVAFCIGGDTATEICTWIYKSFYVWLIRIGTAATVCCFVLLYLNGSAHWVNPIKYWKDRAHKQTENKQ